jgi:flagellar hook-basal body complex protein FliE
MAHPVRHPVAGRGPFYLLCGVFLAYASGGTDLETSMDTKGIDQMLSVLRATAAQAGGKTSEAPPANGVDFGQVLKNTIEQVNETQRQAEDMAAKFAAGDGDTNLHEVMISLQKANLSFQEMVQVRNRLVTAYHDVMNMQV